jgi:hypothetical protein
MSIYYPAFTFPLGLKSRLKTQKPEETTMNENQTDRDEWLAAVEHNRKERIALLELASFMGWEGSPKLAARSMTNQGERQ